MDMAAITDSFDIVTATVMSIKAGANIILMPVRVWNDEGISQFKNFVNIIYQLSLKDALLRQKIECSYNKIIKLKKKFLLHNTRKANSLLNNFEDVNTFQNHLSKKSVTIARNNKNYLPFEVDYQSKILILGEKENILRDSVSIVKSFLEQIKLFNVEVDFKLLEYSKIETKLIVEVVSSATHVIVLSYNLTNLDININKLFSFLDDSNIPNALVSCRNPYDIRIANLASANILIHGVSGFDQTNYVTRQFNINLKNGIIKIFKN
jgi:beta-N-acetylhexosaminidase